MGMDMSAPMTTDNGMGGMVLNLKLSSKDIAKNNME